MDGEPSPIGTKSAPFSLLKTQQTAINDFQDGRHEQFDARAADAGYAGALVFPLAFVGRSREAANTELYFRRPISKFTLIACGTKGMSICLQLPLD